jgi:hypothetical protein
MRNPSRDSRSEIVRTNNNGEDSLPERQMQKPDRKELGYEPQAAKVDSYLLHFISHQLCGTLMAK